MSTTKYQCTKACESVLVKGNMWFWVGYGCMKRRPIYHPASRKPVVGSLRSSYHLFLHASCYVKPPSDALSRVSSYQLRRMVRRRPRSSSTPPGTEWNDVGVTLNA